MECTALISYVVASLASIAKLIAKVTNNPKDVRFDDACRIAEYLGFTGKGGKGDHNSFSKPGEPEGLNFQKRTGGKIKPYQAKQLIKMIERYWDVDTADKDVAGKSEATGNNDDEETP
jgi:hypothetical protein